MRASAFLAGALAGAAVAAGATGAMAQPGPKLLTTSSKAERASMTPGLSFESVEGVNLIKGRAHETPAQDALMGDEPAPTKCDVTVKLDAPWRRIRHLRTQGFYSGKGYASRPYTQGFYSTGR
ncbi:hypothetical protein [Hyphococcus luteus]|uniref:Uncharacterized protein n=1 Tax=Hyphococcus luteus TaxID=2058213 RepID=A0A2S7K6B0_9PROT|nr:hypothetical protein [Marinicaulis flavus]PQA88016.1 hypothetical protein CW354_06695 [Marinicaulis flavus]